MDLFLQREKPFLEVFTADDKAKEVLTKQIVLAWNDKEFKIIPNFIRYIDANIRVLFKDFSAEDQVNFPSKCAKFFFYTQEKLSFNKTYEMSFVNRLIKMREKLGEFEQLGFFPGF